MKNISKFLLIFQSIILTTIIHQSHQNFDNNDIIPIDDCQTFKSSNLKINNSDIEKAALYLAPSYFALIIKEIIPNENLVVQFIANSDCLSNYFNEKNQVKVRQLLKYSAKSFPDYGDEEGCLSRSDVNNAFLLFTLNYYVNNSKTYKGKFSLLPFISKGYSFYGLCIENTKKCTSELYTAIENALNSQSSVVLNGIDNLIINTLVHTKNDDSKIEKKGEIANAIFSAIFLLTLFIRIIVWICGYRYFKEKEDDNVNKKNSNKKKEDDDSSSSEEEEEEDELLNSQTSTKEVTDDKKKELTHKKEKKGQESKKLIHPKFHFFYKLCSFTEGFKCLLKKEGNMLFKETDLYLIIFFKFIALLIKVFNINFDFFIHNPSKEINNTNIFQEPIIYLIKFSSFCDVIIIISESIILSYKLMSFLRKYINRDDGPSFGLFVNFFIRIIPSLCNILVIFIVYYAVNSILILGFKIMGIDVYTTKIQHLENNILDCRSCVSDAKNLIPFYMHYYNFKKLTGNINDNCFHFMIIFINLFYCYCFCIILTYLSFKIKNKIFDIAISILFLINFLLPNELYCDYLEYFNVGIILGETCSTTCTHLFIKYYSFGYLIGFALFYNNDITVENSLQISDVYKPFYYLKSISGWIFKSPNWIHILIIIITIGIQVILSCTFFIFVENDFQNKYKTVELSGFDNFIYLNEKSIYAIAFGVFLMNLYTYKTESGLKQFGNNIIIIFFHRISYDFYALTEIIIFIMYTLFGLNYSMSSSNLSFITFGIIFYIMVFGTINNLLLFIPLKYLLDRFLHPKKNIEK